MKCRICGEESKGKECRRCYCIKSVPKRKEIIKQREDTVHIFDMHNVTEEQKNKLIDEIMNNE